MRKFSVTKRQKILEREPGWNRSLPFHSFPCHSISQRNISVATGLVGYDSDGSDNGRPDSGSGVGGFSTVFDGSDSGVGGLASSSMAATQAPTALEKPSGEKRLKRSPLMQIHSDTVSAAKAALHPFCTNIMPQKHQRKKGRIFGTLMIGEENIFCGMS